MDDLDELFNDPSAGHALRERVEALRLSGCSQTVSWSRHGTIAYITPDGSRVETRHLMCDPHTGRWDISPAYSHPRITATHEGQQLVHITWNMLGAELAVIDVHGRVSIHCVVSAINDMSCVREANRDQEEDMNAIVGFGWLNLDRPYVVYKACIRQERDFYRYPAFQFKANGPFNPHAGRNAGMGITRAGVVKLWYQVEGLYKYQEVTCELEGGMSAEDVFTHASFASDVDSTIVLAAYTISRKLRVFRIFINWNNQQQSSQIANAATMTVRRLRVDDLAVPMEVEGRDTASARLTKLEVLPPTPVQKDGQPLAAPITILATYVYLGHTNFTVVARWVLQNTTRELNPAVIAMGAGRDGATVQQLELKRLEDFIIEKCVIDVTAMFATNFVSFICTDGTVDQRERISFISFPEPLPNFDEIHNMGHAGFRFKPGTEIYKTIGLSPNQCAALRITSDDRVQLACFEQIRGKITDELMLPMVAAVAQQHAFGCKNGHNNDDLLCAIQNYKSPAFNKLLLRETHRSLSFSLDFTGEQPNEKLFRNPTVQKCLSLQNILDYAGDGAKKSLPAKMAWILLLIRIASFAFGSTVNLFHREGDSDVKAEELQPLIGIAKWTTDLFAYIVDGLFELKRLVKGREKDLAFVRQKAVELNSPALFLVLASGSRVLLRYCSRGLKSLQQKIEQRLKQKNIHDGDTYTTLKTILLIFDNCPAKVPQFERIITDLESNVRVVYQGIKEEDRGVAERAVFVDNTIPPVFLSPVEFLFRNSLKKLWEETDLDKLHFYDLSWLGLHDDYLTIQYVKKNPIDIIRKTPIRNLNGKMIRCVRCCSQIEDADKHKAWIGNLGRMCVCGSLWMVQEVEKHKVNGDAVVPMINVGSVGVSGHVHA